MAFGRPRIIGANYLAADGRRLAKVLFRVSGGELLLGTDWTRDEGAQEEDFAKCDGRI